ncbi:hypothetical protein F0562_028766 [Nyssa sinensis]|uniref:Serine carboxypeptidase-like 18 n=1 Tax=Nyssa sinensis TaxID=561372 RepID=A0A5J5B120_9ASTE|nr:hypothetical protein F0562_028766 [Nyssa sinensis]
MDKGFSYSTTSEGYNSSDTLLAAQTCSFLRKWLMVHPEFLDNPLYIGGVSYSGLVVPVIVQEIYNGNEAGLEPSMNINGYLLGNPYTNETAMTAKDVILKFVISILQSTKENCNGNYIEVDPDNASCLNDLQLVEKCMEKIYAFNILEPSCDILSTKPKSTSILKWDYRNDLEENPRDLLHRLPLVQGQWCREYNYLYSYIWANDKTVQEALHIREGTIKEWMKCNSTLSYVQNLAASVEYHQNLTNKRCRALIYSGDHDYVFPYVGTQEWIHSLSLEVENGWEPWFVDAQVAGYTEKYSHNNYDLTFATVKGAGHTAPEFKPKQCLAMVNSCSYIGVGETDEVQLFYYFFESQGSPKDDALVLWLSGGPGCSALYDILYEIGPLAFDYGKSTRSRPVLKLNPYSWTKVANIIFLEAPVGTGYSYATTSEGCKSSDTLSAAQTYSFLRKWLIYHPEFLDNPLYIGGLSYSGIVIPVIVQKIYDGNEAGLKPSMNINGYLIGNPYTNKTRDLNSRVPFAHRVSLLSDELYESTKENCNGNYIEVDPDNALCVNHLQVVEKGTKEEWVNCNATLPYEENMAGSVKYHQNLTNKLCRALIYSGDHDMVFPYVGTQEWIQALKLTVENGWEPWFVDAQVAGYTEKYSYNNYDLTFATIKGAGHTAPEFKPKQSFAMVSRWFAHFPL